MSDLVLLNGILMPATEARISPLDRGFIFGDGVYEVARVVEGRALFLARHLERLARSLALVDIPWPGDVAAGCEAVLAAARLERGSLYIQVTRGAGPRAHLPPREPSPTWLVMPGTQAPLPSGERPLRAVTLTDPRWARCDIKTTSLMGTVLGKLAARDGGADEVVFVGPDGALREGGSTSLFVRVGDRLLTHPLDGSVLPSITRARVLGACATYGLECREEAPRLGARADFAEAFLCGTLTGVQPLVGLDDQALPAGPFAARIATALEEEERREVERLSAAQRA
jgi:D-alanine transaminase